MCLAKASNTTNLLQHLRKHHPVVYAELGPRKQPKQEASPVQPTYVRKCDYEVSSL